MLNTALIRARLKKPETNIYIFDVHGTLLDEGVKWINGEKIVPILRQIATDHVLVICNDQNNELPIIKALLEEAKIPFCEELYFDQASIQDWETASNEIGKPGITSAYNDAAKTTLRKIGIMGQIKRQFMLQIGDLRNLADFSLDMNVTKPDTGIKALDASWGNAFYIAEIIYKLKLQIDSICPPGTRNTFKASRFFFCDDTGLNAFFTQQYGFTFVHAMTDQARQQGISQLRTVSTKLHDLQREFSEFKIIECITGLNDIASHVSEAQFKALATIHQALLNALKLKLANLTVTALGILQTANADVSVRNVAVSRTQYVCKNVVGYFPVLQTEAAALSTSLEAQLTTNLASDSRNIERYREEVIKNASKLSQVIQKNFKIDDYDEGTVIREIMQQLEILIDKHGGVVNLYLEELAKLVAQQQQEAGRQRAASVAREGLFGGTAPRPLPLTESAKQVGTEVPTPSGVDAPGNGGWTDVAIQTTEAAAPAGAGAAASEAEEDDVTRPLLPKKDNKEEGRSSCCSCGIS